MDAMSGGTISRRPRSRANSPHSERDPLRKNFRDWILRYIRSAAADCNERTGWSHRFSQKSGVCRLLLQLEGRRYTIGTRCGSMGGVRARYQVSDFVRSLAIRTALSPSSSRSLPCCTRKTDGTVPLLEPARAGGAPASNVSYSELAFRTSPNCCHFEPSQRCSRICVQF
jgi:hypothetical protein